MLSYVVAFLVLVIAFFVVRMSNVLTSLNMYLASIQELLQGLRQDIQKQDGQKEISQCLEKIHEEVAKIAADAEENLPDCAASLHVILDRTVSSMVDLQGIHAELRSFRNR
jgi:predicted PurR-regulated permease PerM